MCVWRFQNVYKLCGQVYKAEEWLHEADHRVAEVITEGKSFEDCRFMLRDALQNGNCIQMTQDI